MTSSISNKYRNDSNKCPGRLLNISIIEDEFNFLMICSTCESKRKIIPDTIYGSFPNVKVLDAKEEFIWLMSQEDVASVYSRDRKIYCTMYEITRTRTRYIINKRLRQLIHFVTR